MGVILSLLPCLAVAFPRSCNVLDANPFFMDRARSAFAEDEINLLIQYARYMDSRAPLLLTEFTMQERARMLQRQRMMDPRQPREVDLEEATTDIPAETTLAPEPETTMAAEPETTMAAEPATTMAAESATTVAEEPAITVAEEPATTMAVEPETTLAAEPATTMAEEPATIMAAEEATTVA